MREVHIPIPERTCRVVVRKRLGEAVDGEDSAVSPAFRAAVDQAVRRALHADAKEQATAWSALWSAHRIGRRQARQRIEEVELACSGPDDGVALSRQLEQALGHEAVAIVPGRTFSGVPTDAAPLAARWGKFNFGPPSLWCFRGRPVAKEQCQSVDPRPTPPLVCPACGHHGPPHWKCIGYPSEELSDLLEALEAHWGDSELDLLGCIPPKGRYTPANCGSCGTDLLPASGTVEEIASDILGGRVVPVSGFNKVFELADGGGQVWVGHSKLLNGVASFVLHPSMLRQLGKSGLLALQMDGGAVLFTEVAPLLEATAARETGRPRLRVPLNGPLVAGGRCDGAHIPLRSVFWAPSGVA